MIEKKGFSAGALTAEAERGYIENQLIRNCYTLQVTTQIEGQPDNRKAAWEFSHSDPLHFRFLGYTSSAEIVRYLAYELKTVAERFE